METQQARKAADTARRGQIGQNDSNPTFSESGGRRALCPFLVNSTLSAHCFEKDEFRLTKFVLYT